MTDAYAEHAFGVWVPKSPVFQPHAEQLFWDPVNGSDNNPGTNRLRPVKSADKIRRLLQLVTGACDVNMRSGRYVLPDGGVFLEPRVYTGLLRFRANAEWDPTVFTALKTEAAGAGTTDESIALTGMVADAFEGLTVEVTSAGGVVQRKTIRNNTTTEIIPVEAFILPIAEGDAVRVLQTNAIFVAPTGALERFLYTFCSDSLAMPVGLEQQLQSSNYDHPVGLALEGVAFSRDDDSFFFEYAFGKVTLYMYGVETGPEPNVLSRVLHFFGTEVHCGCNLDTEADFGWGVSCLLPNGILGSVDNGGTVYGYIVSLGGMPETNYGSYMHFYGGRCSRFLGSDLNVTILGGFSIPYWITPSGASTTMNVAGERSSVVLNGLIETIGGGEGLDFLAGATLTLGENVTRIGGSGNSGAVSGGARIILLGDCNYGDAVAADWQAFGSAAVNKSFFAAQGDTILGSDNVSYVTRAF